MTKRAEFLRGRQRGLGGSDIPTLVGMGYRGADALDLYYEKTRPFVGREEEHTIDQLRGHVTEPVAAALYWDNTGRKGRKAPHEFRHPDYPAFLCHLDYEIFADDSRPEGMRSTGVLDIKAPRSSSFSKVVEHGARQYDLLQMHTYLAVTRREWGSLGYCSLEHDQGPMHVVDVLADPKLGSFLLELGQRFWDEHVVPGIPPDPEEWKVIGQEGTPPLLERDGTLLVVEPEEAPEDLVDQAHYLLGAIELRERGVALEAAAKKRVQEIIEGSFKSDRIEIPGVGKFTIVRVSGRTSFREDTLRAARPVDRDKLLAWMSENGFIDSSESSVFTWEDLEAMTMDLDQFVRHGTPYAFLRSTDKRPSEATYE